MKKTLLRGLFLLLALTLLLASCGKVPTVKMDGEIYTIDSLGRFLPASERYQAKAIFTEEALARISRKGMDDLLFYEIEGVASDRMIATEDYDLFYAEGLRLPELWEMEPTLALICKNAEVSYSVAALEGEPLDEIVTRAQSAAAFPAAEMLTGLSYEGYEIKFESALYPGIYYRLNYRQYAEDVCIYQVVDDPNAFDPLYPDTPYTTEDYSYEEDGVAKVEHNVVYNFGKYILYDRTTGKCFAIGDAIAKALENSAS